MSESDPLPTSEAVFSFVIAGRETEVNARGIRLWVPLSPIFFFETCISLITPLSLSLSLSLSAARLGGFVEEALLFSLSSDLPPLPGVWFRRMMAGLRPHGDFYWF